MKKRIMAAALGTALALSCAGCGGTPETGEKPKWEKDGTLSILTVGNSFSDDTMEYVWQILKGLGVENVVLGNLYYGGCSILQHIGFAENGTDAYEYRLNTDGKWETVKNSKMSDAVANMHWDYICFQQASGYSGIAETYDDLETLVNLVKFMSDGEAEFVWNMTWAYQQNSTHVDFKKYGNDQEQMYRAIVEAVQTKILPRKDISAVSPCGTAIQNARTSYLGDTLTRDGYHLNLNYGRYTAGLTFVKAVTGLPAEDTDYVPRGVSEEEALVAKESAKNAVERPFEVTQSQYQNSGEE